MTDFTSALLVEWNIDSTTALSFFISDGLSVTDKNYFEGPFIFILLEDKEAFVPFCFEWDRRTVVLG